MLAQRLLKRKVLLVVGIFALGVSLLFYQNCGAPIQNTDQSSVEDANAPFVYDVTPNQVTYMSCTAPKYTTNSYPQAYFSFKIGAYDDQNTNSYGLRVSDEFWTYADSKLKKSNGQLLKAAVTGLIARSTKTMGAVMQFSIRYKSEVRERVLYHAGTGGTGKPVENIDYKNIWVPLTNTAFLDMIIDPSNRNVAYDYVMGAGPLEAPLYFNQDEGVGASVREQLQGNHVLALTYLAPNVGADSSIARSPADFDTTDTALSALAYGKGFEVRFQPMDGASTANPNRIMGQVAEYSLMADAFNRTKTNWSCPAELRLKMFQAATADCPLTADYSGIDPIIKKQMTIIRHHLLVDDWYVNIEKKCIIPKHQDYCYATGTGIEVEYDVTKTCSSTQYGSGVKQCAHFVSICLKN